MTVNFEPLEVEQYEEITSFVSGEHSALVDYVYRSRLSTIKDLMDKFPKVADSPLSMLSVIGKVNGGLFPKFKVSIYPAEVSSTIAQSAYSIGILIKGK